MTTIFATIESWEPTIHGDAFLDACHRARDAANQTTGLDASERCVRESLSDYDCVIHRYAFSVEVYDFYRGTLVLLVEERKTWTRGRTEVRRVKEESYAVSYEGWCVGFVESRNELIRFSDLASTFCSRPGYPRQPGYFDRWDCLTVEQLRELSGDAAVLATEIEHSEYSF